MAKTPQKDSIVSDDELFEFYLSILPPFLSIDSVTKEREGQPSWPPTACDVSGYKKSKVRSWIDDGRVPSKMVDGKRKVQTFGLLKLLFSSPDDKPTQLKHAPLEGRQYRRTHERIARTAHTP
jgi:hypothetical protein